MGAASARDWAQGYFEQAQADLRVARVLQGQEPSVFAMLMQMTLEKLAKAALLRGGHVPVEHARKSHKAASTLVRLVGRDRGLCDRLGLSRSTVNRLIAPLVDELERSHPSLAQTGPCLEYPREDNAGTIRWPARDLPLLRHFTSRSMEGRLLFELVDQLGQRFDDAFP